MAYSVTAIHWAYKKNKAKIYPVKILVTVGKVGTPLHTPHKVSPSQWDNTLRIVKDHPNAKAINADIRRRIVEKEAELLDATRNGEALTKELIKGKKRDITLVGFATEIAKKIRNRLGDEVPEPRIAKEINRIIDFKGAGVLLSQVDVAWLRKYDEHEQKRDMAQNTRNTTFKWLRNVLMEAVAEKLIKENRFDNWDMPKYVQGDTVYLVEEEKNLLLKQLDKLPQTGYLYNTLVHFLAACYAGPRHSDWAKFGEKERYYGGFYRLRPQKKSKGFVVMPVGKTLNELLQRIYQLKRGPLSLQKCNDYLKVLFAMAGIQKDGTTHVGRHSFGYLCASKGLPKSTTAELMGISVQTVEVYYHLTGENIIKQAAALKDV
jgi:site-specific recombinase XerD